MQVAIAGMDHMCMLSFELAGLVTRPEETGIVGQGSLVFESGDIADFGEDARDIYWNNALNRRQCIGDSCYLCFNEFAVILELTLVETDDLSLHGQDLVDGTLGRFGKPVRRLGCLLFFFGQCLGIHEVAFAMLVEKAGQLFQRFIGNLVNALELID